MTCSYDQCTTDADCPAGPCMCDIGFMGIYGNVCLEGNCHTDADCGPGGLCSPSAFGAIWPWPTGYYCQTCQDNCAKCPIGICISCNYDPMAGQWVCGQGC
jgi:hypothetical protein